MDEAFGTTTESLNFGVRGNTFDEQINFKSNVQSSIDQRLFFHQPEPFDNVIAANLVASVGLVLKLLTIRCYWSELKNTKR